VSLVEYGEVKVMRIAKEIDGLVRWKKGELVRARQSFPDKQYAIWPTDSMGPTTICVPEDYLENPPATNTGNGAEPAEICPNCCGTGERYNGKCLTCNGSGKLRHC
jgi:hypothetical protein